METHISQFNLGGKEREREGKKKTKSKMKTVNVLYDVRHIYELLAKCGYFDV